MRRFVRAVEAKYTRIDCLINNAAVSFFLRCSSWDWGLIEHHGRGYICFSSHPIPPTPNSTHKQVVAPTRTLTAEGLELQFAVNILSYVLVMVGLAKLLKSSAPARVINVASNLAGDLDVDDLQFVRRTYDTMTAYKQSKAANRMLSWHAAGALFGGDSGVTVNAMHPGVTTSNILTGLGYQQGWDSDVKCAETAIFLATSEAVAGTTGRYFVDSAKRACEWQGMPDANAALWRRCEELAARVAGTGAEEE